MEDSTLTSRLLAQPDDSLFASASLLRERFFGKKIIFCAIINIRSGNCGMDCKFCAQSKHNMAQAPVYGLLPDDELQKRINSLAARPVAHIGLVASGQSLTGGEFARLLSVLDSLPSEIKPRLCASLGRLASGQMEQLKNAGINRYHHNLETSRVFYPHICTTQTWESRKDTVMRAISAGLEPCSGGLFGMGETWEDRISLAMTLKELNVKNVPLNFLHPQPCSPLGDRKPLEPSEALRVIAIFRHILPDSTLRVCGGRPICLGKRQDEIFSAGANALMSGDYLTTPGQGISQDMDMLAKLGLENDQDHGQAANRA